jgi:hypothetical protein
VSDKQYLTELAAAIEYAVKNLATKDEPEGTACFKVSGTFAAKIAAELREIAGRVS